MRVCIPEPLCKGARGDAQCCLLALLRSRAYPLALTGLVRAACYVAGMGPLPVRMTLIISLHLTRSRCR